MGLDSEETSIGLHRKSMKLGVDFLWTKWNPSFWIERIPCGKVLQVRKSARSMLALSGCLHMHSLRLLPWTFWMLIPQPCLNADREASRDCSTLLSQCQQHGKGEESLDAHLQVALREDFPNSPRGGIDSVCQPSGTETDGVRYLPFHFPAIQAKNIKNNWIFLINGIYVDKVLWGSSRENKKHKE